MVPKNGYKVRMDEATFDRVSRDELRAIEDAFGEVDPDDVEVSTSDGVLRLDLKDGTKIVINSHRAARQIWMAAVASAWHFDPSPEGGVGPWKTPKTGEELRPTLVKLVRDRIGVEIRL